MDMIIYTSVFYVYKYPVKKTYHEFAAALSLWPTVSEGSSARMIGRYPEEKGGLLGLLKMSNFTVCNDIIAFQFMAGGIPTAVI